MCDLPEYCTGLSAEVGVFDGGMNKGLRDVLGWRSKQGMYKMMMEGLKVDKRD